MDTRSLTTCRTTKQVHDVLTGLGVPDDPTKRLKYLRDFMGVVQSFASGKPFTIEEEYELAKQQLVLLNEDIPCRCG